MRISCQEALELLYDIIDREASTVDRAAVEEHLKSCRDCFKKYRLEGAIQDFIDQKLQSDDRQYDLSGLRAGIASRLDAIDSRPDMGGAGGWWPFRRPTLMLVMAASFLLVMGMVFVASGFYKHSNSFLPLEEAHWAAQETQESFENPLATTAAIEGICAKLNYTLEPEVVGFSLVGGHVDTIDGVEMAHFVYSNGETLISVFVAPGSDYAIPEDVLAHQAVREQTTFFDHHCRDCRLVFHRAASAVVITATTDRKYELLAFVPGHPKI